MKYSGLQLAALIGIPLAIAVGQILFKITSSSITGKSAGVLIEQLARSPYFWAALAIYGTATLAWIGAIRGIPISRAYMFMALSFVYVPLFSYLVLAERITTAQMIGTGIIVAGIVITGL